MSKEQILSPLPGIFYRRASPESEEFKLQGDSVCVGDVIGLAEVMKSFHEITHNNPLHFLILKYPF